MPAGKKPAKLRADVLMVEQGLAQSRARAQALIMAGAVYAGDRPVRKPGDQLSAESDLRLKEADHPWVSRGGMKLAHGLEHFGIDPAGMTAADIGASTGGFTDVLIKAGAAKVYAVDVGQGQLDWSLRQHPRVVALEKVNARYLSRKEIPEALDLIVCDASFISLKTVLPAALALARPGAFLVALIKPQFEAGREQVGKGGVVRDPAVHERVCGDIRDWLEEVAGWRVSGLTESPVTGPKGNVEFLIAARRENRASAGGNGRRRRPDGVSDR